MKRSIKKALRKLPGFGRLENSYYETRNAITTFRLRDKLNSGNREEIFTHYYRENLWNNPESFSGWGSTLEYTENLRKEIPPMLEKFKISSILDAPCGDFNWFRFVERGEDVSYLGGDIVADLIQKNSELYENVNTTFMRLDVTTDSLPAVDLWLCRDALFHFSNADIDLTLRNFIKSDIKYLFTTTHHECTKNTDIMTGQFRLLNLELPPFNFPPPILSVDDWIGDFSPRRVGLWERATIADLLNQQNSARFDTDHR
jgi:hypothetical protein